MNTKKPTFLSKLSVKLKTQLIKIQNKILKLRWDNKIIITDKEYKELLCETYNIPYAENISMDLINVKDINVALEEMVKPRIDYGYSCFVFCRNFFFLFYLYKTLFLQFQRHSILNTILTCIKILAILFVY